MSCGRMENKVLGYLGGRLKDSERLEMEKHLELCAACRLRVHEFRVVSGLLDELPMITPSPAFDARVHALVAAEPAKQSWWARCGSVCGLREYLDRRLMRQTRRCWKITM
jgi:anti-sigma factor RsiW